MKNHITPEALLPLGNFDGIFCDAVVFDELVQFISIWGRMSRMQSFYGAISAGELNTIVLNNSRYPLTREMDKIHGKMPATCRFGADFMHAMLYRQTVIAHENQLHAVLIGQTAVSEARIFAAVQAASPLAVLPHWQAPLLAALRENGTVRPAKFLHRMDGVVLDLTDLQGYQALVSKMVRDGRLTSRAHACRAHGEAA